MPYSLTPVMQDCARVLGELSEVLGRPPKITEMAAELDICRSRTFRLLEALIDRGWVERRKGRGLKTTFVLLYRPPPVVEGLVALTEQGRAQVEAAA